MQKFIEKDSRHYTHKVIFENITDLYNYLIEDPKVSRIFKNNQSSLRNGDFYGESLKKALEYCVKGYSKGFDNFLENNIILAKNTIDLTENKMLIRTLYGGVPQPGLVAAGVPDNMLRYVRDDKTSFRNIYFNLSYPYHIDNSKIINRGIATLYIIQALEAKGDIINFKTFSLIHHAPEYVNIEIVLKKPSELFLDIQKCYYPLVAKEFLRRLLFRVLESIDLKYRVWSDDYGYNVDIQKTKDFYKLSDKDLVIGSPNEMDIFGVDIYDDTISLINKLGLTQDFDIEKIRSLKRKNKSYQE